MVQFRRTIFLAAMLFIFLSALPLQAQTSATLNVTVRVVEECEISVLLKRRLAYLARKTGRTDLLQNCSRGVVSRVSERSVDWSVLQPRAPLRRQQITREQLARRTSAGRSDVVLVTISY